MSTRRNRWRNDRGETLVELVLAVAILGMAGVAIISGLMVSVQSSVVHRNDATAGAYVRSFAESIQGYVDSNGYKPCGAAAATYSGVAVPDMPLEYPRSVTAVKSWNGSTWVTCTPDGIQRLDLLVTIPGDSAHRADERLTVILRKPCNGSGADPCG